MNETYTGTEAIMPVERTKGSDRYRGGNQDGDGVQVSLMKRRCYGFLPGKERRTKMQRGYG